LVLHGAKVYLAARTPEKGKAAVEELRKLTNRPDNVQYLKLDLANIKQSKEAAKEFMRYLQG